MAGSRPSLHMLHSGSILPAVDCMAGSRPSINLLHSVSILPAVDCMAGSRPYLNLLHFVSILPAVDCMAGSRPYLNLLHFVSILAIQLLAELHNVVQLGEYLRSFANVLSTAMRLIVCCLLCPQLQTMRWVVMRPGMLHFNTVQAIQEAHPPYLPLLMLTRRSFQQGRVVATPLLTPVMTLAPSVASPTMSFSGKELPARMALMLS